MYRELRPAPLRDGQQLAQQTEMQPKMRNRASLACQPCRQKRRKCSGQRPECGECVRRVLRCVYEAAPGQTRMASLRESKERMSTDLDTMMELYWYLQTKPEEEARKALSAIQTGANPSQVMEAIKKAEATPDSSATTTTTTPIGLRSGSDHVHPDSNAQFLQSELPASSHGTQISVKCSTSQSPTSETAFGSSLSKTVDSLSKGAQAFISCTGCIFYIYDQDEAEKMLHDLRPYLESAGTTWSELIFQGTVPSHLIPSLCSLCIMAAVGLQYTKDPIPALSFQSSGSDGSYKFVSVFYESARHLLEAVIEINVVEAMKVCAALTLFNILDHATIAMAYADMGINFVLNHRRSLQNTPDNSSEDSWLKSKRDARTLVTLRSWLTATLGYIHKEDFGLQTDIQWLLDNHDLTPSETIQQGLNKVVQIEANLLRTIDSFRGISPALLECTRRDLAQWHQQLPAWMHLSALLKPAGSAVTMRRTIFLVHLFYLSANILLARLAYGTQQSPFAEGTSLAPRHDIEEVRIAAGDGVQAARTAARILQLQMDEQAIFQRCWNCEFSAYMSCLMLLHSVAQMQLHNFPQSIWRKELSHARSCLSVLEHCSKADKVADRFAEVVRGYYNTLAAQIYPTDDTLVYDTSGNFDYLFSIPSPSPPQLAQASHDLLKRISCPFDSPSSLHDEDTLKAGLDAHLTLPFNRSPPQDASSWSAVEIALSSVRTGHFMGSSQPHGWVVFSNLNMT